MSAHDELLARLEQLRKWHEYESNISHPGKDSYHHTVSRITLEAAIKALSAPSATAAIGPGDGISAGRFHCACVFSRPTDFAEAVLVSACAYHSKSLPVEEMATASGNPLLWNVHCMYQQAERDMGWQGQWRDLLAAIEQHLQRVGYPNGGSDMKGGE